MLRPSFALAMTFSLGVTPLARAADLWAKAAGRDRSREREVLVALARTQEGTSDALDELLVRTAMVDAARGKRYDLGLTTVLALRARRLLGLPRVPGDLDLLRQVIEAGQEAETTALAALELGRLWRSEGEPGKAALEFDRALGSAWRSETRVEAHLMRGWFAASRGDARMAQADFRAALTFDLGRSQLALSLASLAYAEALAGDLGAARGHYARARAVWSSGEAVSLVLPSQRPELLPHDRSALDSLERRLRPSATDGDEDHLDP